ncbi:molybdenum cofactor biosynthesis protein MoaE [Eionea flava]
MTSPHHSSDAISIQTHDFDVGEEHQQLRKDSPSIGAIVTFTGIVRELYNNAEEPLKDKKEPEKVDLFLEHYAGMTEKVLADIIHQAKQRWAITHVRIIHRIGHLSLNDQIVFIGVNSPHRADAFSAAAFIMDFLKTDAPFWKKEITSTKEEWVAAKTSDARASNHWISTEQQT